MRERHLDGTVLISDAGGTVFESFARPNHVGKTVILPLSVFESFSTPRSLFLIPYPDTITTTTLSSCSSLLLPCDAGTRVLELLVLLVQHWSFAPLKFPICLISRRGREILTFV